MNFSQKIVYKHTKKNNTHYCKAYTFLAKFEYKSNEKYMHKKLTKIMTSIIRRRTCLLPTLSDHHRFPEQRVHHLIASQQPKILIDILFSREFSERMRFFSNRR